MDLSLQQKQQLLLALYGTALFFGLQHRTVQSMTITVQNHTLIFPPFPENNPTKLKEELIGQSGIQKWYSMEKSFMKHVQPQKLTIDGVVKTYKDIKETSNYVGYLKKPEVVGLVVFISLGIIYVIVMLFACILYVSYRCCCRKGRLKYYPEGEPKKRGTLSLAIWLCGVLMFTGVILVYTSSKELAYGLDSTQEVVDAVIVDMRNMMNDTSTQIKFITHEGLAVANGNVSNDLNAIGAIINVPFQENLKTLGILENLHEIGKFDDLNNVLLAQCSLVKGTAELLDRQNNAITTALGQIDTNLGQACAGRRAPACGTSGSGPDYGMIVSSYNDGFMQSDVLLLQNALIVVQKANLSQHMQDGIDVINGIPQVIASQTKSSRQDIEDSMDNLQKDLDDYLEPIEDITNSVTRILDDAQVTAHSFTEIPKTYGPKISYAGIGIATWFLLITVLYATGSILGALKFDSTVVPTERRGIIVFGGNLLYLSVHLMLYLAWILMLLTVILMVIGTQIDEIFCTVLESESSNFVELDQTLDTINQSLTPVDLDLGGKDLRIAPLLASCKENRPIYAAMNMKDLFDVTSLQNRTKKFDIDSKMGSLTVDLTKLKVFDDNTVKVIDAGLKPLDGFILSLQFYLENRLDNNTGYYLSSAPDGVTLSQLASKLEEEYYNWPALDRAKYEQVVQQCRDAEVIVLRAQKDRDFLHGNLKRLNDTVYKYRLQGGATKQGGARAQDFFTRSPEQGTTETSATAMIVQLCRSFGYRIFNYVQQYIRYVIFSVQSNIGLCKPVYAAYHAFAGLLCGSIIQPINGLWFAIGLCVTLYIPLLFMNVHLARFYIRAKEVKE